MIHAINRGESNMESIKKTINKIINFAAKNNKKVIATSNAFYLYKYMSEAHNVFIYNKLGGGKYHRFLVNQNERTDPPLFHLLTTSEMTESFNFITDEKIRNDIVVENTYNFAENFECNKILLQTLYTPEIEGVDTKLMNLVETNLENLYGSTPSPIIRERVNKELEIIIGKGYAVIY
jgi:DNA polymerase-3 subunit alpha (Gram-positive type)